MSNFRLQLLHHDAVFSTREEAVDHINDNFKYEALVAEPALFYYGNARNPYFILAFGVGDRKITYIDSGEIEESIAAIEGGDAERDEALALINEKLLGIIESAGLTYDENKKKNQISYDPDARDSIIGDAESIAEAVDLLSKYVQESTIGGEVYAESTKSIEMTATTDENKNTTISANVLISETGSNDDADFNNNMIGIKKDGLYAAANLDYDEDTHKLTFTASGMKNGSFKNDATRKVIDLGEHSKYTADNESHNIKITITPKDSNNSTISADAKLSEDEDNILRVKDGKLLVEGRAKNIKFNGTTVAKKLNDVSDSIETIERKLGKVVDASEINGAETDTSIVTATKNTVGGYTISNVVRLSSDNSITVANGGLSANIDASINSATNTLTIKVGNNTKILTLPGIDIISDMYYDSANKVLVIKTSDGKTISIPVADMLATWVVENSQTSPVVLTKTTGESGSADKLSAGLKIASTDNLISKDATGQLYVSESNIDNKIGAETTRATEAERELKSSIENGLETVTDSVSALAVKVDKNTTDITAEETRAKAAEAVLTNGVERNAENLNAEIDRAKEKEGGLEELIAVNKADIDTLKTSVQENSENITANNTAINKEIADRTTADENLNTAVTALSSRITTEVNRATAKENELADNIATANTAIAAEVQRATGAEATLGERISGNTTLINNINDGLSEKFEHVLDDAKEYTDTLDGKLTINVQALNAAITAVDTSAKERDTSDAATAKAYTNAAKETLTTKITALENIVSTNDTASRERDAANLETAKAYTDSQFASISSSTGTDISDAKEKAIETAAADATTKANAALESAKAYTDAETTRAKAAEQTNATAIAALQAKDTEIEASLANKIESVVIEKASSEDDLNYNVYVNGTKVGEINIPKDQILSDVTYDSVSKVLTFLFDTKEGPKQTTINIADLIDTYTAGNGLKLEDNQFSVKVDGGSESYLVVTADGVKVVGIDAALATKANASDVYTKTEADSKFLTEHQDISSLATKAEVIAVANDVDALDTRVTAAENKIDVINGNEATEGSIKKALADAKEYAKGYTDAETTRATAAEQANADAIAIINGNEAIEGSIKKALKDAKTYTDDEVSAEETRAKAAEQANADAIAIINGNSAQDGSIKKALADAKEYANERTENVNTALTEQINTLADTVATKANSSDVYTKAEIEAKSYLTSASLTNVATKSEVEYEATRAKAAEQTNATAIAAVKTTADTNAANIAALQTEATRLNLTAVESNSIIIDLDKEATGTKITADLKLDTEVTNILKIGGNGVYADVEMEYSASTNTITFSNGVSTKSFTLSEQSLVVGGIYDSADKAIKLTVQTADGTSIISIPVGDLIHSLNVENTTQNPVKLTLTQDASGIDVLSASLDISTKDDNAILKDNGTLYVSNNAEDMVGYWGSDKISLQAIINKLKNETDKVEDIDTDVTKLKSDMTQAQHDIVNLKADNTVIKSAIETQNEKIATMDGKVDAIVTQYENISSKVSTMESQFTILENKVNTYSDRITAMENSVASMKSKLEDALKDIAKLQTAIGGGGSGTSILDRLTSLENIVNNLIDFADTDSDGTPDGY